jgi:hypothetical protein
MDPSTTPNEVAVPKVIPIKMGFWDRVKHAKAHSGERMAKVVKKHQGVYDKGRSIRKDVY